MAWRRLRAGELDHEALWLGVSVTAAGLAWAWVSMGWPTPRCAFHAATGVPCPGCGATRAFVQLTHGGWDAALGLTHSPALHSLRWGLFDLYALTALLTRAPRWRGVITPRAAWRVRIAVIAAVLANWAWVIHAGV